MYSPKISEEYIPYLYRLARHLKMPMTKLVNEILRSTVERFKQEGVFAEVKQR